MLSNPFDGMITDTLCIDGKMFGLIILVVES
jgi:hypothetical protein